MTTPPGLLLLVVVVCAATISSFCVARPIEAFSSLPVMAGAAARTPSMRISDGHNIRDDASGAQSSSSSSSRVVLQAFWGGSNNPFGSLLGLADRKESASSSSTRRRQQLLDELLKECTTRNENKKPDRSAIERLIDQLQDMSPVTATAASPQLQKRWKLIYTTEKEINFFLDFGIATEIYQTIDGATLQNAIPFENGGSFGVEGTLRVPDARGVRTEFEFAAATLNLGKWGEYRLPPVGQGWFDTVYLDDSLRIDRNSRNDILICQAAAAS